MQTGLLKFLFYIVIMLVTWNSHYVHVFFRKISQMCLESESVVTTCWNAAAKKTSEAVIGVSCTSLQSGQTILKILSGNPAHAFTSMMHATTMTKKTQTRHTTQRQVFLTMPGTHNLTPSTIGTINQWDSTNKFGNFSSGYFISCVKTWANNMTWAWGAALCKTPSVVGTNKVSQKIGILWYTIHTPT